MILEELSIPYEVVVVPFSDVKKPEYTAINPNGRLPAIHDPNTDLTLWESGAIIEYLIERYDTKQQISFPAGSAESYHAKQWLYFQASGQGPYYGQAAWFSKFHPEPIPSAIDRYVQEVHRVSGVLNDFLATKAPEQGNDGPWLVGNKISYADISFIAWQKVIAAIVDKEKYSEDEYPHLKSWIDRMSAREPIAKALETLKPSK